MQIDLRFSSKDQGSLAVVVAPVLRFIDVGFNADIRIEEIGSPDKLISGFAPELFGAPLNVCMLPPALSTASQLWLAMALSLTIVPAIASSCCEWHPHAQIHVPGKIVPALQHDLHGLCNVYPLVVTESAMHMCRTETSWTQKWPRRDL
jgi:hypothetical protein